ncbi:hypothetical protein N7492_006840 [Penicillium capsulatum]|uniref:Uncharacterized protein n=1 Tax=Penicillium capsulatum TaxID=69766 RepID=A0A9W9LL94_9EURO|nr:hypothetical protein N7492_006840 [Penicillium capsulatum]KAJ6116675.1 hypothetical protein N7512_006400 [Penicillium capsulatum]
MAHTKTSDTKAQSIISVESADSENCEKQEQKNLIPKPPCPSHGPSQSPLLDHELQNPRAKEILLVLSKGLNDLSDDKKCTQCTVQEISTALTGHVRDIKTAKQNGEWSKKERKTLKAEIKSIFKPVKKDIKVLWKEGR